MRAEGMRAKEESSPRCVLICGERGRKGKKRRREGHLILGRGFTELAVAGKWEGFLQLQRRRGTN